MERDAGRSLLSRKGSRMARPRKVNYNVKIVDDEQPDHAGIERLSLLKDELYYHIQMQPDVQATCHNRVSRGSTGRSPGQEPSAKAACSTPPLGHRDFGPDKDDPLRDPNLGRLVIQGVEWVSPRRRPLRNKPETGQLNRSTIRHGSRRADRARPRVVSVPSVHVIIPLLIQCRHIFDCEDKHKPPRAVRRR